MGVEKLDQLKVTTEVNQEVDKPEEEKKEEPAAAK